MTTYMNGQLVHIDYNYGMYHYQAIFNSYDGAPDTTGPDSLIGIGETAAEALDDLRYKYEEMTN